METAEHPEQPPDATPRAPAWPAAGPREDGVVVLDRYRLVRRLGGGGFGVVWLAHDLKLDRAVAVKRIPAGDDEVAGRARREGLAAARLQHPAIVALHETGADDEAAYLVTELVRGPTLAQLLTDGALSDRDVVAIGLAMCDALAHAHGRGVVHRDVKPSNVLVPEFADGGPVAKLADFGVARIAGDDALTHTGDVVGTLAYMAPEQAEGGEVGAAADLYALGLCLFEGLAGVNPVRARGAGATVRRIGLRLPPLGRLRRDLPGALCDAIDAAVWPRPEERGTVRELRAALAAALDEVEDDPGTIEGAPLEPLTRWARRSRAGWRSTRGRAAGAAGAWSGAAHGPAVGPWPGAADGVLAAGDSAAGLPPSPPGRALAALGAGALAGAAVALLPDGPGVAQGWWWPAAAAAVAVAVLPRVGWLLGAVALVTFAAVQGGGAAWLLVAAAAPVPLLLRRAPAPAWSAPALAPALGLLGLAGAFPALAALARRPWHRLALGALGAWWALLGEVVARRVLLVGGPASDGTRAIADVVHAPALGIAAVWALAALVLPWLVRGRHVAVDVVAAVVWAAVTASAAQAVAGAPPRGLVLGAVVAGALPIAFAASRGRPEARW